MALTFPTSPTNGQLYTDTATGNRYIYDSAKALWKFSSNSVGMSVSSTPPANVAPGAMWFNREIGRTFVYYDDGDSKQWIETVPATGSFDSSAVASYANAAAVLAVGAAYNTANAGFAKANTALQNTTGTFAGALTTTGAVTANSYVYITPAGGEEGGEIQLNATGSNTAWSLDSYQNNFRVFARSGSTVSNVNFFHATGGSVRMGIGKTDPLYELDVNGTVNASALLVSGSAPVTSTTSPWVLVGSVTATNGAAIQNTTFLTSSYGRYMFVIRDVFTITNATTIFMQFYSGGAYQTANYYAAATVLQTAGYTNMPLTTALYLSYPSQSSSVHPYYGIIHMLNPANTTYYKPYFGHGTVFNGTSQMNTYQYGGGWQGGTGAITGFQVYAGSGNITGTVQVYGAV